MTGSVQTMLPHQLPPDTLLANRYRLVRVLGEGGFGITYEARDETLRMRVAVKEYFPRALVTRHQKESGEITVPAGKTEIAFEKGKEAFLNEARTLAQFQQDPNIISVTNFFEENRTAYIVMEYLDGQDLGDVLGQRGTLSFGETLALLRPIMESLSVLHDHGLIHRDISPSNIRILPNGAAKLLDFGASREIDTSLDASRSICLKPGYSPEEQYRSRGELGPWTDVYALSATMYHMLAGFPPDDSLQRILLDEVKKPSELGVHIPAAAEAVLMRGLSVQAKDRYRSVREMADAMEAALAERTPAPQPIEKPDRLPWMTLIPVAGLVFPFEMTRRTGRKRFSRVGTVFLVGTLLVLLFLLITLTLSVASGVNYYLNSTYLWNGKYNTVTGFVLVAWILWGVLYGARAIYAVVIRKDYLRYRAAYLRQHPPIVLTEEERKAGKGLFCWRVLGVLPRVFGYAGIRIGRRTKRRSLVVLGIASRVVTCLLLLFLWSLILSPDYLGLYRYERIAIIVSEAGVIICLLLLLFLFVWHLNETMLAYPHFFEQECRLRAPLYSAYPNLNDRRWRAENSRWQIWTWIPLFGGLGLFLGGARAKRRDLLGKGVALLIANAVLIAVFALLSGVLAEDGVQTAGGVVSLIRSLTVAAVLILWVHGAFVGVMNRFSVLSTIAETLGPYYSRAEKEIAETR